MTIYIKKGALSTNKATVIWDNAWANGTITATSELQGYPAINVADPSTNTSWRSIGTVAGAVMLDAGYSVRTDCFGIAAHNIFSMGATISIQYSFDGSSWNGIMAPTPDSDDDIMMIFPEITARYWRFYVSNPCNIGVIFSGKRLIFPNPPVNNYTALHHAKKYTKYFNTSIGGHLISNRVQSVGAETEVNLGFVKREFVENNLVGFQDHYNQGGTFFYAGVPSMYPKDIGYCTASSDDAVMDVSFIHAEKLASLKFGVRAYVGS